MPICKFHIGLTLLCAVLLTQAASSVGAADPLDALAPKSLVSQGNLTRLDRVFERASADHPITIGVIGGSITQGAMATKPKYRYGNLVALWFARTFPKAKVSLINSGLDATGTHYGCLHVRRDLLFHHPDFVIVEFAINDCPEKSYSETYEAVIRQILSAANLLPGLPTADLAILKSHSAGQHRSPISIVGFWSRRIGSPLKIFGKLQLTQ